MPDSDFNHIASFDADSRRDIRRRGSGLLCWTATTVYPRHGNASVPDVGVHHARLNEGIWVTFDAKISCRVPNNMTCASRRDPGDNSSVQIRSAVEQEAHNRPIAPAQVRALGMEEQCAIGKRRLINSLSLLAMATHALSYSRPCCTGLN